MLPSAAAVRLLTSVVSNHDMTYEVLIYTCI